ncbi:MAG: hypothetical protein ACR2MO_17195, partial [Acidimicrobiales bacterium]
ARTAGALALFPLLRRRVAAPLPVGAAVVQGSVAAGAAWAGATLGAGLLDMGGRTGALLDLAAGGVFGLVAGGVALWATGGLRTVGLRGAGAVRRSRP